MVGVSAFPSTFCRIPTRIATIQPRLCDDDDRPSNGLNGNAVSLLRGHQEDNPANPLPARLAAARQVDLLAKDQSQFESNISRDIMIWKGDCDVVDGK
jgi:hypothetical protein